MADTCETVKVVSTHPKSQGDFVEINKDEYDEKKHKLYIGKTPDGPPPSGAVAEAEKLAKELEKKAAAVAKNIEDEAKKLVEEVGLELHELFGLGTGKKGLVTVQDVEKVAEAKAADESSK